jgi:hypothetical protein
MVPLNAAGIPEPRIAGYGMIFGDLSTKDKSFVIGALEEFISCNHFGVSAIKCGIITINSETLASGAPGLSIPDETNT